MRILFFGDSITQGFYDGQGGWVQRLANEYHMQSLKDLGKKQPVEIFNLGISGDLAEDVLKRLPAETEARVWKDYKTIVVLAVGLNNATLRDNRVEQDVYKFQDVYEKLLSRAVDAADQVLCMGLTAVDEALANPWKFSSTGKQWLNNRINLFEDTIKQCAEYKDVPFVPIHDRFLSQLSPGHTLLSDGLHPNEAGHQLIVEWVKPELSKLLV